MTFHKLFDRAMYVDFDPRCVVEPDDSIIVRHAAPVDARAREQLREQHIQRMQAEAARERVLQRA